MSGRPAGDAGFTLIETLVALAIVGMVLTTVYGVFGSGLRSATRDEDRLLLALVAQNLLARSRFDLFPAESALTGDIGGGLRWRVEGEPYPLPENLLPEAPATGPEDGAFGADAGDAARGDGSTRAGDEGGFAREAGSDDGSPASPTGDGGSAFGDTQAQQRESREPVRLRLVRVTVEKGSERFALAGLVTEPRRDGRGAGDDRLR